MKVASWTASRTGHGFQLGATYVKTAASASSFASARGAARASRGTSAPGTPIVRPCAARSRAPRGVATSAATASPSTAVAAIAAMSAAA